MSEATVLDLLEGKIVYVLNRKSITIHTVTAKPYLSPILDRYCIDLDNECHYLGDLGVACHLYDKRPSKIFTSMESACKGWEAFSKWLNKG